MMVDGAMDAESKSEFGVGLYSISGVARLAQMKPSSVRRWALGYSYRTRSGDKRHAEPIFGHTFADEIALSFLDLVEILFVKAFRDYGVSMKTIRAAAATGVELFGTDHPFAVKRLETDGRSVFA